MKWVVGLLLLVALTACTSPEQKLEDAGAQAAREAASEVGTTRLAVQQLLDGKLWPQPTDRLVASSEKALDGIVAGFASQQPESDQSRTTYDTFTQALDEAATAVTETRIALKNGDRAAAAQQVGVLEKTAQQLTELAR